MSEVNEQGDDRADTFDIAAGLDSFESFRLAKFPTEKPVDIRIHESLGQLLISGGSNADNTLGLDLFSSSRWGDEFVRIGKNVTEIATDFIMDGVMMVNSYNLRSNLEMFDERSIDNERKSKDSKKKHTL